MKETHNQLHQHLKWLHEHPELSFEENETTAYLKQVLTEAGIEMLALPLKTGLVAQLHGTRPGPVVALRCDIDALPVTELEAHSCRSQYPGKMHACGHDFHTAAVLGTALALKESPDFPGTVKFVFQPGEESSLGAPQVIETGVLSDVAAIFGIHVYPGQPAGRLAIRPGSVTAAVDRFLITITGRGCHAAHPDEGIDPIPAAAALITAVQTIVSRNLDPFSAGLVSITRIEGGTTWNVIPESVTLEGTVRSLKKEDRPLIRKRLEELAEYTAKAHGSAAAFTWIPGPPATNNDEMWSQFSIETAVENGFEVVPSRASLGGEDFSFYQETIPGTYIQVGTGGPHPLHHPGFRADPEALLPCVGYLEDLIKKALRQLEAENNDQISE